MPLLSLAINADSCLPACEVSSEVKRASAKDMNTLRIQFEMLVAWPLSYAWNSFMPALLEGMLCSATPIVRTHILYGSMIHNDRGRVLIEFLFIKKNVCSLQPPFVEVIRIGLASRHLPEQIYETF